MDRRQTESEEEWKKTDRIRGRMDRRQTESEEEWIEDRQNQRKNG